MKNQKKKPNLKLTKIILVEIVLLLIIIICLSMSNLSRKKGVEGKEVETTIQNNVNIEDAQIADKAEVQHKEEEERLLIEEKKEKEQAEARRQAIDEANLLAAAYDYDAAIEYIKEYDSYEQYEEFIEAIKEYEDKKAICVPMGAYSSSAEVNHIFFHSLIYDTSKAFDGDYKENGYNYYMTTISEFKEMMRQMYEQGYVLVSIHDVVTEVTLEDGSTTYQDGDIMLPPDKKPFVLSQDDVNYYDYMDGDGFASRVVIDKNGCPSTERIKEDGTTEIGEFDLIPVLETFIKEHPDFSYRGARGIIALTGYEGTLGYRTDPASKDSKTYDKDVETVKEVARVMREYGWEFASHSNGHGDLSKCSYEYLVNDTKKWLTYVGSLVGETDIYIYPYGLEIQSGVKTYNNDKYKYLKQSGFNYFCGVFKEPWIQVNNNYVRMSRRPLDGQAMLQFPERLADLFDLSTVIDSARPKLK